MGEIYHVYNRSISEMEIFTTNDEYVRFINALQFYQIENPRIKFSDFLEQAPHRAGGINGISGGMLFPEKKRLIEIIAYCIMPTHFHLSLKELNEGGIAVFINNLLNSYTRYFNVKNLRKGTLWEGPTKKVFAETDAQFLHLTRYIHLNPVTAHLVDKPEDWPWSSYREYVADSRSGKKICYYDHLIDMGPIAYRTFVEDGISYQREMAKAKKHNPI